MSLISDMSTLDPAVFFEGPSKICNNDLAKMEVANFSTDVDQALSEHFGWRGKATAAVGLTLSADNLRVDKGEFITRGDLDLKEKKLAANSIWPDARANISLHITFPSANVFTFENGGLWSDLVRPGASVADRTLLPRHHRRQRQPAPTRRRRETRRHRGWILHQDGRSAVQPLERHQGDHPQGRHHVVPRLRRDPQRYLREQVQITL
jgi:hypothetical protein